MALNNELLIAIKQCNIELVDQLIINGAELNTCSKFSGSPLINALYQKNIELITLLISHKVDINKVDCFNVSPLEVAMKLGFWEAVALLTLKGAQLPKNSRPFYTRNRINNFKASKKMLHTLNSSSKTSDNFKHVS